jgi:hypothetical protein
MEPKYRSSQWLLPPMNQRLNVDVPVPTTSLATGLNRDDHNIPIWRLRAKAKAKAKAES